MGKLNALSVKHLGEGNHGDGDGLYLRVIGGSRTWSFRWRRGGKGAKGSWITLGRVADFTLGEARQAARECRRKLFLGIDLKEDRRAARLAGASAKLFSEVAAEYIASHKAGWKSAKHGDQWKNTLDQHAAPLMSMRIPTIKVDDVLKVLKAIWETKPETATRLRGRIEAIIDYATARGWRSGENPARWKGHLGALLPARGKVARVEHHPAMPWAKIPDCMTALAASQGTGARCLAFLILTATRSGEARGALWPEIDLAAGQWIIPPERMKGGREHRIPLSDAAQKILREMLPLRANSNDLIFPGGRVGTQLSDVALAKALKTAGGNGATVHGFRSAFRDWCGEAIAVPREVAEAALGHANRDKVEAAYARSDLFERRRALMTAWAEHCSGAQHEHGQSL